MIKDQIENLIFKKKAKDQLIQDTLASLNGLLSDIFIGADENVLKKEFPENINIENITIQLKAVAIYLNSKEFPIPCVEIAIDMIEGKTELEIGTYSLLFDEQCEQIDEILNLY